MHRHASVMHPTWEVRGLSGRLTARQEELTVAGRSYFLFCDTAAFYVRHDHILYLTS